MGLLGMFKRKGEEVIPEMETPENSDDNLGLPRTEEMPEIEINPIHEQYRLPQQSSPQPRQGMDTKDVQLIISKLDLINARLENLNERILSLERAFANQEKRRW